MKLHLQIRQRSGGALITGLGGLITVLNLAGAQPWVTTLGGGWQAIGSSADGRTLVAAPLPQGGYCFQPPCPVRLSPLSLSTNASATWTLTSAPENQWTAVASSADGTKWVATAQQYAPQGEGESAIYVSNDSGASWSKTTAPNYPWLGLASSADGRRLVAVTGSLWLTSTNAVAGSIFNSQDSGLSWQQTSAPTNTWTALAMSALGEKIVAVATSNWFGLRGDGLIYVSNDAGATWTPAGAAPNNNWSAIACSADGTRLIATAHADLSGQGGSGRIYLSADSGATWAQANAPSNNWTCVASSASGDRLVAGSQSMSSAGGSGLIYVSTDFGRTWTAAEAPAGAWSGVACSADGYRLSAASFDGLLSKSPYVPPSPQLSIGRSRGGPLLSWLLPASPFVMQQSSSLDAIGWVDVSNQPSLNFTNLHQELTLSISSSNAFYRLRRQP